ncbi:MAG: hypothetical protein IT290_10365, partial [Deltaproteobacteria bacterium]|nr:hypothetical protein [Deltaproteobacteria bacterium]
EAEHPAPGWKPSSAYFSNRVLIFNEAELGALVGKLPARATEFFGAYKAFLDSPRLPLLSRLRSIDMDHYMPGAVLSKVDRMSMQHALEVRCPILSMEVARFAEKLAPCHCYAEGQGKLVLKEVASRYIPRAWLERKKMGFSVPIALWEQQKFIDTLETLALGKGALSTRFLEPTRIRHFIEKQRTASGFSAYQVWALLILELWLRNSTTQAAKLRPTNPLRSLFGGAAAREPIPAQHTQSAAA